MKFWKTARKLQRAIVSTGFVVKINQTQFYSADQKRMIDMYAVYTPVHYLGPAGWADRDMEIIRTASQLEIVDCLVAIWEAVKPRGAGSE